MAEDVHVMPGREVRRSERGSQPVTDIAGVTRAEWQRFLDFYRPLEDKVLDAAMQTDFTEEGNQASRTARASLQSAQGSLSRELRRRGVTLTADEQAAFRRRAGVNLSRNAARAENTTRRSLYDNQTNLLADIVGIGRGVSQTARGGLSAVADMNAQRQMFNDQSRSRARAGFVSTLATGASLAIAFL